MLCLADCMVVLQDFKAEDSEERQKMLAGELYDAGDPVLVEHRLRARDLLRRFNDISERESAQRQAIFENLFSNSSSSAFVQAPFFCDYGYNIYLGENVYMNFNCCILDVCPVRIGARTMLGPSVQLYTATHPIGAKDRSSGREYAAPITIGEDVWLGGNCVICPGVTIGDRSIIVAGSVVTKYVPCDTIVAGSPARVMRHIHENDQQLEANSSEDKN